MSTHAYDLGLPSSVSESARDFPSGAADMPVRHRLSLTKRVLRPPALLVREVTKAIRHPVRAWRLVRSRVRMAFGFEPLSYLWGGDRGMPPYYHYVLQFMSECAADIQGHCLEFFNDEHASRYKEAITQMDIMHIDDSNPLATLCGDLTKPNNFPSDRFDCIIFTHTLHVILEMDKAVAELHRMLRPGGVLLVAVPMVSMNDPESGELWRFTPNGLRQVLAKVFHPDQIRIRYYGNSLTACGQLRGLTVDEFTTEELNTHDERFAVEVCARAQKPF